MAIYTPTDSNGSLFGTSSARVSRRARAGGASAREKRTHHPHLRLPPSPDRGTRCSAERVDYSAPARIWLAPICVCAAAPSRRSAGGAVLTCCRPSETARTPHRSPVGPSASSHVAVSQIPERSKSSLHCTLCWTASARPTYYSTVYGLLRSRPTILLNYILTSNIFHSRSQRSRAQPEIRACTHWSLKALLIQLNPHNTEVRVTI